MIDSYIKQSNQTINLFLENVVALKRAGLFFRLE